MICPEVTVKGAFAPSGLFLKSVFFSLCILGAPDEP